MAEIENAFTNAVFYRVYVRAFCDSNGDGQIDHQIRFAYDGNQIVLQFEKELSGGTGSASVLG